MGLTAHSLFPLNEVIVHYTYRAVDVVPVSCMFTLKTQHGRAEGVASLTAPSPICVVSTRSERAARARRDEKPRTRARIRRINSRAKRARRPATVVSDDETRISSVLRPRA